MCPPPTSFWGRWREDVVKFMRFIHCCLIESKRMVNQHGVSLGSERLCLTVLAVSDLNCGVEGGAGWSHGHPRKQTGKGCRRLWSPQNWISLEFWIMSQKHSFLSQNKFYRLQFRVSESRVLTLTVSTKGDETWLCKRSVLVGAPVLVTIWVQVCLGLSWLQTQMNWKESVAVRPACGITGNCCGRS